MFALRLLCLTLILVITRIQIMTVNNQVLIDILTEEESEWDKTKQSSKIEKVWHTICYVLNYTLPPGLLGTIFLYSVLQPSLLGLLGLIVGIIIIKVHAESFWQESYVVIGIITQLVVVFTYIIDSTVYVIAIYFKELDLSKRPSYSFIYNAALENLEIIDEKKKFFSTCLWLFSIIAICFVQKTLVNNASLF